MRSALFAELNAIKATRLSNLPFGGLHVVTCQDFKQHQPVVGKPLFSHSAKCISSLLGLLQEHKAAKSYSTEAKELQGRHVWMQFQKVCILSEQHRFSVATEDGAKLYRYALMLMSDVHPPSLAMVQEFCEELNKCAVTEPQLLAMLDLHPKAIVLRNVVRQAVGMQLAQHHAQRLGKRMVMWRSLDRSQGGGGELSSEVLDILDSTLAKDTQDMPLIGSFFSGIHYLFPSTSSGNEHNSHVKNNLSTGRRIVLHPSEPDDDLSKPLRLLRFPPLAIIVQPDGPPIGNVCGAQGIPNHCIPVQQSSTKFTLEWKGVRPLYSSPDAEVGSSIEIQRTGIMLDLAYAVTGRHTLGGQF